MPSLKAPPPIYQLKITLIGIIPPIWRRIQVPGSIKLCCLHSALQVVMGWTDSHLHQFDKDGKNWGFVQLYEDETFDVLDDGGVMLAEVLKAEGDGMTYQYDFGDDWRHHVVLEKIQPAEIALKHPVCLAGERRCPPEDVGGVHGYQEFMEVIFDPKHEEYEQMVRWAGVIEGLPGRGASLSSAAKPPSRNRFRQRAAFSGMILSLVAICLSCIPLAANKMIRARSTMRAAALRARARDASISRCSVVNTTGRATRIVFAPSMVKTSCD